MRPNHILIVVAGLLLVACAPARAKEKGAATRIVIAVTEKGFEPDHINVQKGVPTTLVFVRKTDRTCAKSVVVQTGKDTIKKELPLDTPVEIPVTFERSGELGYACAMDMLKGVITVQ